MQKKLTATETISNGKNEISEKINANSRQWVIHLKQPLKIVEINSFTAIKFEYILYANHLFLPQFST